MFWGDSYLLPFARIKKQMLAESNGNPKVVSPAGAIGLFQLMPATAVEMGVDPHDTDDNIKGGCAYMEVKLRQVRETIGTVAAADEDVYRMALAAYNCGFGYAKKAIGLVRGNGNALRWDTFLEALKTVRIGTKRADWKQVEGYVLKILPPPIA